MESGFIEDISGTWCK